MSNAAMHVARTGLDSQAARMRVIANNLANVNTTGFKKDRAEFETLAYQTMTVPGAPSSAENRYAVGLALGSGVQMTGTARVNTQGAMTQTDNPLDMAIEGDGFFQVLRPDGTTGYTRAGNFSLSAEGQIVTSDGMRLQPEISVPEGATAITIGADGTISAQLQGQAAPSSAASSSPASSTRRACKPWAAISTRRAPPAAPRRSAPRASMVAARSARARWKAPTSTSSRSWST